MTRLKRKKELKDSYGLLSDLDWKAIYKELVIDI